MCYVVSFFHLPFANELSCLIITQTYLLLFIQLNQIIWSIENFDKKSPCDETYCSQEMIYSFFCGKKLPVLLKTLEIKVILMFLLLFSVPNVVGEWGGESCEPYMVLFLQTKISSKSVHRILKVLLLLLRHVFSPLTKHLNMAIGFVGVAVFVIVWC